MDNFWESISRTSKIVYTILGIVGYLLLSAFWLFPKFKGAEISSWGSVLIISLLLIALLGIVLSIIFGYQLVNKYTHAFQIYWDRDLNMICPWCEKPITRFKDNEAYCPMCEEYTLLRDKEDRILTIVEARNRLQNGN